MSLQLEKRHLPESQQAALGAIHEGLFEQAIAKLLASEIDFSEATVRAIEDLKRNMLGVHSPSQTVWLVLT